jgi:isopenicillin-N N-acyltransferase like protein
MGFMTSLPLLHLQGSPHQRGLQHGEELREAIAANVAVYRSRMLTSGVPENALASRSQRFLEQFTR